MDDLSNRVKASRKLESGRMTCHSKGELSESWRASVRQRSETGERDEAVRAQA